MGMLGDGKAVWVGSLESIIYWCIKMVKMLTAGGGTMAAISFFVHILVGWRKGKGFGDDFGNNLTFSYSYLQ